MVGAGIETFKILDESNEIHDRLVENVEYFRTKMMEAGFRHQTNPKRHLRRYAL